MPASLLDDEKSEAAQPDRWNGTLLKCPGCRLKFPFSAENHSFEVRKFPAARNLGNEPRTVLVTHCPQCDGWVTIT